MQLPVTLRDVVAESHRTVDRAGPDDLLYRVRISVWVRWFLLIAWLLQFNYRPNFAHSAYIPTTLLAVLVLVFNAYVHYRIQSNRTVTWHWALALSAMDVTMITAGLVVSGSGFQNSFFVLYYPGLAMFAVVFTSFRLSFAWATMLAAAYAAMSLLLEPGVEFEIKEEKVLFTRIAVMYGIVAAVNLVSRFERIRRREAVEREQELQRERIELSQTIHDTVAQSAYMIGLGLETAKDLTANLQTDEDRDELAAKLEGTHELLKSTVWELRHPHRSGAYLRRSRSCQCASVARLHLHCHHVHKRRCGAIRQRASSLPGYPGAAVLDSAQRDDEHIPPLGRPNGHHRSELRR